MTRDEATKLIAHYKLIVTGDSFHKLEALIDFAQTAAAAEREACLNCYSPDDTATDWADKIRARGNV